MQVTAPDASRLFAFLAAIFPPTTTSALRPPRRKTTGQSCPAQSAVLIVGSPTKGRCQRPRKRGGRGVDRGDRRPETVFAERHSRRFAGGNHHPNEGLRVVDIERSDKPSDLHGFVLGPGLGNRRPLTHKRVGADTQIPASLRALTKYSDSQFR